MRGALALLPFAAAAGFGFTSEFTADQQAWTDFPGYCEGYNIVPYSHPKSAVYEKQCYSMCADNPNPPAACAAFDADTDGPESHVLCMDDVSCRTLCWSLDECQSTESDGNGRCYMNTWECSGVITGGDLTASADFNTYAKQVPWQAECNAAMTVEVSGGNYGVDGTYAPTTDDANVFARDDGIYRISWNGCDWRLQRAVDPEAPATGAACRDDTDGANFLFGLTDTVPSDRTAAGYDPHICARGKVAGYCANALFEGVCAETCGLADLTRCWGDNTAAAAALADIWGVENEDCMLCAVITEGATDTVGSYDPVVQSICKTTCGGERFEDAVLVAGQPDPGDLRRLSSHQVWLPGRRLMGHGTDWKDYFWTEWPTYIEAEPPCTAVAPLPPRDLGKLTDLSICDSFRFENAVPGLTMAEVCPETTQYTTEESRYCPFQNVLQASVEAHRCVTKCTADSADSDCAGYDAFLGADSDALCLPREECEALCTSLGDDCIGIDLHKALPRCYLNAVCDEDLIVDSSYQLLTKRMGRGGYDTVTGEYCVEGNVDPRTVPHLRSEQCFKKCPSPTTGCDSGADCDCSGARFLDPTVPQNQFALCLSRPACEEVCAATPSCVGFDMHKTLPRCFLNIETKAGGCTIQADSEYELVEKRPAVACFPGIERDEGPADDGYATALLDAVAGTYAIQGIGAANQSWTRGGGLPAVTVTWYGCEWRVEDEDGHWLFSSVPRGEAGCGGDAATAVNTSTLDTSLYYAACPLRKQMEMELVCEGQTSCPVLYRCVIGEAKMTTELAGRPGGRAALLGADEDCAEYTTDPQGMISRQLASPSRAEYSVDMALYGPALHGGAEFRMLQEQVFRSAVGAPLAMVNLVHESVRALNVISTAAADADRNIGVSWSVPPGYERWASDLVRLEAFGEGCGAPVEGKATVAFRVGDLPVKAYSFPTTAAGGMPTPLEGDLVGDWLHVEVSVAAPVIVAAAVDWDECANMSPCAEGAACTNVIGGYECTCPEGTTGDGKVGCTEITYECPAFSFRVSNAESLDFGWRVREMKLFIDKGCSTPVVGPGPATLYAAATGRECVGTLIPTAGHTRELLRLNNCFAKCGAGSFNTRRLSRQRRLQVSGSDWSNCDGFDAMADVEGSATLCLSQPSCEQACNQLEDCKAYVMASDNRCLLYSSCEAAAGSGTAYMKSARWSVTSSPAFEGHPNSLLVDGYGKDDVTDDSHLFTEWWSNCFSCEKEEAWFQVSVEIPDSQDCKIEGLKVWQDPYNAVAFLNVAEGPRDRVSLPGAVGVRPDSARELPDVGEEWVETWRFPAEEGACLPLTCGKPDTYYDGEVIKSIEGVVSACLCKQYCLDHLARGCTGWRLRVESDANWDPTPRMHTHNVCELLRDHELVPIADPIYTSGDVGTIVQSFTPADTTPSTPFTLEVSGVGLPSAGAAGKQRLKLVLADGEDGCAAAPPETVSGVGCSDPAICAPRPAKHTKESAGWSSVAIASAKTSTAYAVCYCAGPCYAAWQYVRVPGGTLLVESTESWWSTEPAELDRNTGSFTIKVECPAFSCLRPGGEPRQDPETWRVKLVDRQFDCSGAATASVTYKAGTWAKGTDLASATWEFDIAEGTGSAGKYLVCFCEVDEGVAQGVEAPCLDASPYVPIASAASLFLTVSLVDADLTPPSGLFRGQRYSAFSGNLITLSVGGRDLGADDAERQVAIAENCADLDGVEGTQASEATSTSLSFDVTVPADAGVYAVCVLTQSAEVTNSTPVNGSNVSNDTVVLGAGNPAIKVGELAVTTRVDLGWTYIFDPNVDGSLEVSGRTLDWRKDRLLLADCSATCGHASPASDAALLGGEAATLKVSNSFVALNEQFDLLQEDTTSSAEPLPSQLRTYVRRSSSYCRSGNLGESDLGAAVWAHQCHAKCSTCQGPGCDGCDGYSPNVDGPESQALCMSEVQCREVCSSTDICYGIDMYKYASRCYLNAHGDADFGCEAQYAESRLGVTAAYDFLAKDTAGVAKTLAFPDAVSTTEVLRFAPVGFARQASGAGKFKVCFCDSALLPAGQTSCLSETDYSLEVGELYVSGVSCLLANPKFRRGTCYSMFHGGLACSEENTLPALESLPPSAGLPTSWSAFTA